jgi:hypothetical protein
LRATAMEAIPESDLGAYFSCPDWQQKENG